INPLYGQPSSSPFDLHPPLSGELTLSGSFGEIRTNSFHAGIDFRTGGRSGLRVFASNDGFVSRVRVSGVGFGKAIYIQHPNGLTTVYAHLDRFAPQIEAFVKEQQYKQKSFVIDLHLNANEIKVKRGEYIALSGNSGSSGGPHLHYEVRLTKNQIPLNPAFSNLKIVDTISPLINSTWIYSIDTSSAINGINTNSELNVQRKGNHFVVEDTVSVQGIIGVGLKAYDYINRNSLRCGVYEIKMFVNDKLHYHYSADEFNFNETRYANSHIDYAQRQETGKRIHRLFREPNNLFSGYKTLMNNGFISTKKDTIYNVKIEVNDPFRNSAKLIMVMKGIDYKPKMMVPEYIEKQNQEYWLFFEDNQLNTDLFSISLPRNTLYSNLNFEYKFSAPLPGMYSSIIHVHNKYTPVHRNYKLSIKADSLPIILQDKALIATLNSKDKMEAVGGSFLDGYIVTNTNFFGDFFIVVDTIAPQVKPLNISNNKDMSKERSIRIMVGDDISGIASIEGFIDNEWALFEHDPKNNLVFYEFDEKRLQKDKKHSLLLKVIDNKGNLNEYSCTFFW
ncbi:MAG: hypothetical protein CVT98_04375, partial [Bacteroidetes bacterium HGW-Bacteroidetes-15]